MKLYIERISNGLYMLLFGFIFLWIMLGFLRFNIIFQLIRLWPLFFVVAGIEIIFRKTKLYFVKLISPIIVIFSVFGIIYVSQGGDLFHQRQVETIKMGQKIISKDKITDIDINFSSGTLFIDNIEENIISGDLLISKGIIPKISFNEFDNENVYKIYNNHLSDYVFSPWDNSHVWDIRIGNNISSKVKTKTYMSRNKFNFSKLSVSDFILETKISSNEIILNRNIKKVRINSLGSVINIAIPKEMGVKMFLKKVLIIDNFEELGLERGFQEYTSSNYNEVVDKVDIDLDLKLSEIKVKYY
ncbi:MAG: hypothetical protein P1P85_03220 [Patescibacteria group bacterium]|nr:hypothetical protein [Patescibacteria group bacterium]